MMDGWDASAHTATKTIPAGQHGYRTHGGDGMDSTTLSRRFPNSIRKRAWEANGDRRPFRRWGRRFSAMDFRRLMPGILLFASLSFGIYSCIAWQY